VTETNGPNQDDLARPAVELVALNLLFGFLGPLRYYGPAFFINHDLTARRGWVSIAADHTKTLES
jgi:hypothetical protein